MEETFTVAEVAERLRVDKKTIYRLVESGRLRALRVGRVLRIPLSALAELEQKGGMTREEKN